MRNTRAILVFSAVLALPAFSDQAPAPAATPAATPAPAEAKKASKKPAGAKAGAPGTANMIVTKDPETGELRPATAAEREKLLGRRPQAAPVREVITLPDGTVMVELGEADMSYAVATRNPDGSISRTCVHGGANAAKAAESAAAPAAKSADR